MTATAPVAGDAPTRPDLHPQGVNHLALSTRDMKGQLTFWSDVLGCPVKALDPSGTTDSVMAMSDDEVWKRFSETTPPVGLDD